MPKKGPDWKKTAAKLGKWTFATAVAGWGAAAAQGADLTDPTVAAQVAFTAVLAGVLGASQNAWKHRVGTR